MQLNRAYNCRRNFLSLGRNEVRFEIGRASDAAIGQIRPGSHHHDPGPPARPEARRRELRGDVRADATRPQGGLRPGDSQRP